jgi:hypothetical protein
MRGQRVCTHHGGRAPQAKEAAAERIKQLAEGPALIRLAQLIGSKQEAIALAASRDALDRAGYGAKQTIRHEMEDRELRALAAKLAAETGQPVEAVLAQFDQFAGAAN